MAIMAECNQIFRLIVPHATPSANVVNLEVLQAAAILTPPAIAFEHSSPKVFVGMWIQSMSSPFGW